jgi:hypothetical protein
VGRNTQQLLDRVPRSAIRSAEVENTTAWLRPEKTLTLKMWKWESSLVETLTFQSNRKNGTSEKPKFERDLLESRSSSKIDKTKAK